MPPDMGAVVDFEICLEWESSSAEVGLADLPLEDWIGASKDPKPGAAWPDGELAFSFREGSWPVTEFCSFWEDWPGALKGSADLGEVPRAVEDALLVAAPGWSRLAMSSMP